jgi:hypothetical protein
MTRSRLALPILLGLLSGSTGLVGCQSSQSQPNDGPSGSGLMPPAPAANGSMGNWLEPPRSARSLPLDSTGDTHGFLPPLPGV